MPKRPLLLGHRGARVTRSVAENSVASFDLALSHGCDGFELDVRCTKDAALILCHDPTVGKIEVASASRSDLPEVALLEEVLARYAGRAFLDVELKVRGVEKSILALLEQHPPRRGFVVSSFFPEILLQARAVDSDVPLGLIADRQAELGGWRDLPVQYVMPHYRLCTRELIEEIHASGRQVCIWTVNQRAAMQRFAEWGADAIISDDTELLVRTLGMGSKPGSMQE
jgi:glycerophosphoryl diester phosphodiesterase